MDSESQRIAKLTEAEKEVLWLFLRTAAMEDIARQIERTPVAIEQRFARARTKLGVRRTLDAAHMLARVEHEKAVSLGVYAKSDVADYPSAAASSPSSEGSHPTWLRRLFPTEGRPWNALPASVRLGWIAAGLMVALVSTLLTISLQQGVSSIFRPHH